MIEPLTIHAVEGIGEIKPGDDLAEVIVAALAEDHNPTLTERDVVVVTQKIVSKAEGRLVEIDPNDPLSHKPLVEQEAVRVLRRRGELLITETTHGFVCANAGIDLSNVQAGQAALLPIDPDRSARRIHHKIRAITGCEIGVLVTDTFGRPWRRGVTDVAIGSSGLRPVIDLRGTPDALGRELHVTEVAIADELAAAADLIMGKSRSVPVAIIRGVDPSWLDQEARHGIVADMIRDPSEDLFR